MRPGAAGLLYRKELIQMKTLKSIRSSSSSSLVRVASIEFSCHGPSWNWGWGRRRGSKESSIPIEFTSAARFPDLTNGLSTAFSLAPA